MKLEFDVDPLGNKVLTGQRFEKCQFSNLEIIPPIGTTARLENCQFLNCSTYPGSCQISGGVTLDNVVFSNFHCGEIRISSEAELRKVVIEGKKPKTLLIRPWAKGPFEIPEAQEVEFQLDISDFPGEVIIVGMRGKMIRKDPTRQVTILAKWQEEVDWKGLSIGPLSYWRILVRQVTGNHTEEGVFSLPKSSNKHYAQIMREREILEKAGLRFD